MSAIDELEAQLRASWDDEAAAVYADALQAAGDPRGEIIALDLQLAADRSAALTAALTDARQAAVRRWLGDDTTDGHWPAYTVRHGLVDATLMADAHSTIDERADALLGSPGGRYLRHVTVFGDARTVQRGLDRLAAQPRPWLAHLTIDQTEPGPAPIGLIDALARAAPQLRSLELRGERVLASPLPASVRTLALRSRRALAIVDAPVAGVTELDLTFDALDVASLRNLAALCAPRAFPDLQRLDLSRNEASYPAAHPRNLDPMIFVRALGQRGGLDRLRVLRLPALRRRTQLQPLRAVLDAHPVLEIEVARHYRVFTSVTRRLVHPRVHLPPPRPWRPGELLSGRDALVLTVPGRHAVVLLAPCVAALEQTFDHMTAPARAGWTALWEALDDLSEATPDSRDAELRLLPIAPLAAAFAEVPRALDARCADTADMLRETAAPTVELQRHALGKVIRHRGAPGLAPATAPRFARHPIARLLHNVADDDF